MAILNMIGKPCPIPVIEAKRALKEAKPGEVVELVVDNDIARQNLQKMAEGLGSGFGFEEGEDGNIKIQITPGVLVEKADGQGLVVTIGQNQMGHGSEELGKILIKSFIFSLTELDTPPEKVLFFNSGVHLTVEGANTLDDLRVLEEKGTQINSCGACLNFYNMTEKLAVGSVTNMYSIASSMAEANRLINL